jgi:hypothetical protein
MEGLAGTGPAREADVVGNGALDANNLSPLLYLQRDK